MIARLAYLAALIALSACKQSVEVLGMADTPLAQLPDGGLTDAPDLPDPPPPPPAGSDAGAADCDPCGALPLCTADGCVDASGLTALEAGRHHTCLVRDGRLFCWGVGNSGELGQDDRENRDRPARIGSANDWRIASGGERHTCGIRAPGSLLCWGDNALGQLGLGDTEPRLTPTPVAGFDDWVDLDCGGHNCCALRDGGRLYCWGDNLEGKAGQQDSFSAPDVLSPLEVAGDGRYRSVALGQGHVCAIDLDGALWCWGRALNGETGTLPAEGHKRSPQRVGTESDWTSVSGSQHHTCGTRADGSLWCWGRTGSEDDGVPFGELGQEGTTPETVLEIPTRVGDDGDWERVEVGWFHSCGLKQDGRILCWGRAIEGQLGQGGGSPVPTPTEALTEARFDALALGAMHSCAVDVDDVLHCWGENMGGQLGLGDLDRRHEPTPVP